MTQRNSGNTDWDNLYPVTLADNVKMASGDTVEKDIDNIISGTTKVNSSTNSDTATKLQTARSITLTGDISGNTTFDGSANASINATLANSSVAAGTYKSVTVDAKGRVTGGSNPTTLSGYGITDALPASNYTASDVLAKIKTADGSGSGLDADTLDGIDSNTFYQSLSSQITSGSNWNNFTQAGAYKVQNCSFSDTGAPPASYGYGLLLVDKAANDPENRTSQMYIPHGCADKNIYIRMLNGGVWTDWRTIPNTVDGRTVWDSDNDGPGSGLDADTLDGLHSSSFATSAQGTKADNALPSSSYTASDVLTKIKTVDGAGSGLDADTIDGKDSSAFAPSGFGLGAAGTRLASGTNLNTIINNGWYDVSSPVNGVTGLTWHKLFVVCSGDLNYVTQVVFSMTETQNTMYIRQMTSGTWGSWNKVWNDGNDGSGSGLDADTLDGLHSSSFATSTQGTKADNALPSSSYTASDVLAKIKTVDGAGSGLDADTVDGNQPTIYAPPGIIAYYANSWPPAGWLIADGSAISRTAYAALYNLFGTYFGAGDGSTTFNLPDLRGQFIRCWDDYKGLDSGRTFGSLQSDAFKAHYHEISTSYEGNSYSCVNGMIFSSMGQCGGGNPPNRDTYTAGDTETRPKNIALLPCIKY